MSRMTASAQRISNSWLAPQAATLVGRPLAVAKRLTEKCPGKESDMADIYQKGLRALFGLDVELGGGVRDAPWMRQVLRRRTHRRYSDQPVPEPLVRLL